MPEEREVQEVKTFLVTLEHPIETDCAFADPNHLRHFINTLRSGRSAEEVVESYNDENSRKEPCEACGEYYKAVSAKAVA